MRAPTWEARADPDDSGNWQLVAHTSDGCTFLVERCVPRNEAKWMASDWNAAASKLPKAATLIKGPSQVDLFAG